MTKAIDITGKKFNLLTAIERVENSSNGRARWKCLCDCGNITYVTAANLKNGAVKSCGCLRHRAGKNRTHGMSKSRLYLEWAGIKSRCFYSGAKKYKYYGGRGIKVCDEWAKSFETFKDWALKNGYNDSLTIERIDVNGDYCPENCKWITRKEQSNNTRRNVVITYNGKTQTLLEWVEELGLDYKRTHNRLFKLGWTFERAITTPVNIKKRNKSTRLRKEGDLFGRVFEQ